MGEDLDYIQDAECRELLLSWIKAGSEEDYLKARELPNELLFQLFMTVEPANHYALGLLKKTHDIFSHHSPEFNDEIESFFQDFDDMDNFTAAYTGTTPMMNFIWAYYKESPLMKDPVPHCLSDEKRTLFYKEHVEVYSNISETLLFMNPESVRYGELCAALEELSTEYAKTHSWTY